MMKLEPYYVIRFFFDAGSGTFFWPGNDAVRERFGTYFLAEDLPLSDVSIKRAEEIVDWQSTALNWESPTDPGSWRQDECDRFNQAVKELLEVVRQELGDNFVIVDESYEINEDPDLDAYLRDPKGFRRT